ncbi:radical SAM/SPASM domain-containing protein [Staphylothermus hellenicus]|uniref:Radical SAM domain protein n=1 Tax=Staphylothermus hellenicus (strain DSM 12710 / JCM 10830 / BK20S6-10-b1 / P8) TaxID=591019 RepID=D7DAS5_STAHD|nr:radical SAM/SPASM domain-containing protein [Staphylothermus hellenicus]ADI31272.1 Radical SAM domain protein [Staphylothermus hellenicus DSM 12710]
MNNKSQDNSKSDQRGGIGALLAGLRTLFDNPVSRIFLKTATIESECNHNGRKVTAPIVYHALSMYAGEPVSSCPITARFIGSIVNAIMRLGIKLLKGREDEVIEALKDPALRRGVSLVLKGLGLYGVTVPQELPAPFLIVWNFTNMCNLKCKHCYQRADKPLPNELSLKEKIMVVDQLDRAGVAAIALSGGEPTIHPHFRRILYEIASRGMYAAVATNGWVFADIEKLKEAKKLGLRYVEVSVDSADPKKHDWFRGVQGSWERAVKALENAVKLGINHAMATTITKMNINEVEDLLDLAESIGVKRVVFFNFVPVGRGKDNIWLDLDPLEREEFLRTIYKEMSKRKMEIVSTAPQYGRVSLQLSGGKEVAPTHFYVGGDPIVRAVAEFVGGCGAGRIYAGIQPDGTLIPCVFLPIPVGNLRERTFWDLWVNAPLFKLLRDRSKLQGACAVCPYKNICGGCRARAYAYFNDPMAPDPGCLYNIKYWKKLKEEAKTASHIKIKVGSKD